MKKLFKILGILIVLLIVLSILFGGDDKQSATQPSESSSAAAEEVANVAEPPMAVKAKELAKDYENNEVAADQKYKGKILEVSGRVDRIDSGLGDDANVMLEGSNPFLSVRAMGDDEFKKYAATLSKGANITLICLGDGEIIGSPNLKDCQPK